MRVVLLVGMFVLVACRKESAPSSGASAEASTQPAACIADRVSDLRVVEDPRRSGCEPENQSCLHRCIAGKDASSCFNRALELQRVEGGEAEARTLFKRGCELGDSISCVNYGAGLWAEASDDETLRCAERLFRKTCQAGEQLGCAMRGRAMADLAKDEADFARVRDYLEQTCEEAKGFACRVLAYHYELGDFGEYDAAIIQTLLARACEGGDSDACGEPKTADETFH